MNSAKIPLFYEKDTSLDEAFIKSLIVMFWFYVRKIEQKDFSGFECWESEKMVGRIWYYQSISRIVRFYIYWVWTTLGCHCSMVGKHCFLWPRRRQQTSVVVWQLCERKVFVTRLVELEKEIWFKKIF